MDPAFNTTRIRAFLPVFQRSAKKVEPRIINRGVRTNEVTFRIVAVSFMAEGTHREAIYTVFQRLSMVLTNDARCNLRRSVPSLPTHSDK